MLLQIHDELIFEVLKDNADKMSKIIRDEMTSVRTVKSILSQFLYK